MAEGTQWMGRRLRRVEDPKLLQGRGAFVEDVALDGTLHVALVRSPHAHARVVTVDTRSAERVAGVVEVLTGEDVDLPGVPAEGLRGAKLALHPVLARGTVRYVGEPVAAVVATTRAQAEDAAAAVEVSYEPLEAVTDPAQALEGRVLVHPELHTNVAYRRQVRAGDPDGALARAHRVVQATIRQQRVAAIPLEPRAVLASWDGARGLLTVWSSTQVPHDLRDALADVLGLRLNQIRVVAPDVGGGFGAKLNTYPEEVLVAYLSRRLRRPVKWVETRRENLLATAQGRSQTGRFEVACDARGRVLALRAHLLADIGAYTLSTTVDIPALTVRVLTGPYAIEHVQAEVVEVYTHKTPTGAYRGAGRPEATFYLERLMDLVAAELGLDPAVVRRRNLLPKSAFPYKAPTGARYDTGDYRRALRVLLDRAGYAELRRRQAEERARGRYLGIGLSCYVEVCTYGWETARVRVAPDGSAVVLTGTSPHGQGGATGFAQIVADRLGIPPDRVHVISGDTLAIPSGMGTAGSRTLVVGGSAVLRAAEKVRRKMLRVAAHLLEASPRDVELRDGKVAVRGSDRAVTVEEVAEAAYQANRLPSGLSPGLDEEGSFVVEQATAPFGAHLCVVEVDPETGQVRVLRYVSVDDCGVVVNPLLVEGQIQGGIVQAMGQALMEEVVYDAAGQPLTVTLADYPVPRAAHAPAVEMHRTVTPSPTNPLGAKGVGEAGTIGATPAFANAVLDALRPFGVRHLDTPLRAERIWRAVRESQTVTRP
ncbi:MAG: xanthine dehydrogenase family protein molybdopterin-binding subunit [Armatimonadota bacterium]|nr:xanthine dehydrogenase family protein molybdopterin-binding subunit [Armatimonadota bacterium]MDR5676944.1 xanthine dehydrogenase family protein molybdopterin-binding subunit [Armatimonadota bacterium]MDR5690259.1 xanthine dehydrogenase family protein molybdopterin-binding subunit [Armatimonadota bacterium]MDR7388769.1 xanthine dehydrogenase family protein molybdopterin-binding subunit [Armatimonadota bacterium]MDR7396608.1 xanthine dehydrogenase family protein molybdopterin-binding subunit 